VFPIIILGMPLLILLITGELRTRDVGLSLALASVVMMFEATAHDHPFGQQLSLAVFIITMSLLCVNIALYTVASLTRNNSRQRDCLLVGASSLILSVAWELVYLVSLKMI